MVEALEGMGDERDLAGFEAVPRDFAHLHGLLGDVATVFGELVAVDHEGDDAGSIRDAPGVAHHAGEGDAATLLVAGGDEVFQIHLFGEGRIDGNEGAVGRGARDAEGELKGLGQALADLGAFVAAIRCRQGCAQRFRLRAELRARLGALATRGHRVYTPSACMTRQITERMPTTTIVK